MASPISRWLHSHARVKSMKKPLFFCALLVSTAASAQTSAPASANGAGAGAPDATQMICRNQRETGSMLNRTRVCKTRAEWEADRRDTRQTIDRTQTNRALNGN
jgi:hypothetical protein